MLLLMMQNSTFYCLIFFMSFCKKKYVIDIVMHCKPKCSLVIPCLPLQSCKKKKHFYKSRTCFGTLWLTLILVTYLTSAQLPHFCKQWYHYCLCLGFVVQNWSRLGIEQISHIGVLGITPAGKNSVALLSLTFTILFLFSLD